MPATSLVRLLSAVSTNTLAMKMKITMFSRVALLALGTVIAIVPARLALAGKSDHVEARELLRRGDILSLARILETVNEKVAGDVIEVELERDDNVWEYEVKVLTPTGQVRKLYIDAGTAVVRAIKDD